MTNKTLPNRCTTKSAYSTPSPESVEREYRELRDRTPAWANRRISLSQVLQWDNRIPTYLPYLLACVATLTSFLMGYSLAILNSVNEEMVKSYHLCSDGQSSCSKGRLLSSVVNAVLFLGAIVGSQRSMWAAKMMGCRIALILTFILYLFGGLLNSFAFDVTLLAIGRVVTGMGVGLTTVVTPLYITEMSPSETRGVTGIFHQIQISIGICMATFLGMPLSNSNFASTVEHVIRDRLFTERYVQIYWRVLIGAVPMVVSVLGSLFLVLVYNFDSPQQLLHKQRYWEALDVLSMIYGKSPEDDAERSELEEKLLKFTQAQEESKGHVIPLYNAICCEVYRFPIVLGVLLVVFQQITGVNVICSSSNDLFLRAGLHHNAASWVSLMMTSCNICATVISAMFIDSHGRRPVMLGGLLFMSIGMLVPCGVLWGAFLLHIKISSNTIGVIFAMGSVVFISWFSASMGPVTWIYLSEIYPSELREAALSFCGVVSWMSSFSVVLCAKFIRVDHAFGFFGIVSLVGFFFVHRWVVETKGTSTHDSKVCPRNRRKNSRLFVTRSEITTMSLDDLRRKVAGSNPDPRCAHLYSAMVPSMESESLHTT